MQAGNLHPLIVHLPIGILVLAFLLELYHLKYPSKKDNQVLLFILTIGTISSVFSVASGWLLADGGGYDQTLLVRHKWTAIAFTIGCLALLLLKKTNSPKAKKVFLPFFAVVLMLLMAAGHYGGSLTHGEDFLFQTKYEEPEIENIDEAKVYHEIIRPILERKCVSCHNQGKAKGGLLLGSQQEMLAGGDSGSLLDSLEQEGASLLMHRIHLPLEEKEHMPPKGKAQLTSEEIALMEWWMENEHCFECVAKELPSEGRLAEILESLEKDTSLRAQIAEKVGAVPVDDLLAMNSKGISLQPISEESPLLAVNFSLRKNLTEEDFDQLKDYRRNIVEMNLAYTNLNDTLAHKLKLFKHLTRLQVQQTQITDASAPLFEEMQYLESLNLFGTKLEDKTLESLSKLPNLKQLYVWQTQMTKNGLLALQNENKELMVQGQIADSVFAASSLGAPTIVASGEIFKDSIQVSIEQYIDGGKIFYTVHDTVPIEYTGPFFLRETARLSAFVEMDGWEPSPLSTIDFLKSQIAIKSVSLEQPPNPKYCGKKGLTLMDQKRGSTNFVDGNWLGYEKQHMVAEIEFKEKSVISNVSVGSLSVPNNWIFFPVGYTLWGSADGKTYSKIKSVKLPKLQPPKEALERTVYSMGFDPVEVKKARLLVESTLVNPDWHAVPGGNSWIFLDEVIFN